MDSGTLAEIIVCEHSSQCQPQMRIKALPCKAESIYDVNMIQKLFFGSKLILNQTEAEWETVLWSEELKFEILLRNQGSHIL